MISSSPSTENFSKKYTHFSYANLLILSIYGISTLLYPNYDWYVNFKPKFAIDSPNGKNSCAQFNTQNQIAAGDQKLKNLFQVARNLKS